MLTFSRKQSRPLCTSGLKKKKTKKGSFLHSIGSVRWDLTRILIAVLSQSSTLTRSISERSGQKESRCFVVVVVADMITNHNFVVSLFWASKLANAKHFANRCCHWFTGVPPPSEHANANKLTCFRGNWCGYQQQDLGVQVLLKTAVPTASTSGRQSEVNAVSLVQSNHSSHSCSLFAAIHWGVTFRVGGDGLGEKVRARRLRSIEWSVLCSQTRRKVNKRSHQGTSEPSWGRWVCVKVSV